MSETPAPTRAEIDEAIAAGHWATAHALLVEHWAATKGSAAAAFVLARTPRLGALAPTRKLRMFVSRSMTVEPVLPILRAGAALHGIDLDLRLGEFGTFGRDALDGQSALYRAEPDLIVLALQARDVAPTLWTGFPGRGEAEVRAAVQGTLALYRSMVEAIRKRTAAAIVIHDLEAPAWLGAGVLDGALAVSQAEALREVNLGLRQIARAHAGVHVLGYDALVARHGRLAWHDEAKWLTARMPFAAASLVPMAEEWLRFVVPVAGRAAKCLVLDLDNTLWGGVIGEDGAAGIRLGDEYPGAAYRALQQAVLDLRDRGVLLAIASKNNAEDAQAVLASHPGMLLRPEHFAAIRINWNPKPQSLREIAAELNIGVDALAFLDDSPVERRIVRSQVPEVAVIEIPEDPLGYARALRECPLFERLALSAEDRERSRYYAEDRQRGELRAQVESVEDFYRSLDMEIDVGLVDTATLARVAQLTQKTNQFNLTTIRRSEAEIEELARRPEARVSWVRVRDRFGDGGVVGVAITLVEQARATLDTFLLSCRVIGRTVETAFLALLVEDARRRGARSMEARFVPTKKNAPAAGFLAAHGFVQLAYEGAAGTRWLLDLVSRGPTVPAWIRVRSSPLA
jgi:FkbH-like protein